MGTTALDGLWPSTGRQGPAGGRTAPDQYHPRPPAAATPEKGVSEICLCCCSSRSPSKSDRGCSCAVRSRSSRTTSHNKAPRPAGETACGTPDKADPASHPDPELGTSPGCSSADLRWSDECVCWHALTYRRSATTVSRRNFHGLSYDRQDSGWEVHGLAHGHPQSCRSQYVHRQPGRQPQRETHDASRGLAVHYAPGYGHGHRFPELTARWERPLQRHGRPPHGGQLADTYSDPSS